MITPYNFSIWDTTIWVFDTESPINICNSLQLLNVGDGSLVPVLALRIIQLIFEFRIVMLDKCHYYPSFMMNIISVGLLIKLDFNFLIKNNFYDIIMNDTIIMRGQLKHDIYLLS